MDREDWTWLDDKVKAREEIRLDLRNPQDCKALRRLAAMPGVGHWDAAFDAATRVMTVRAA